MQTHRLAIPDVVVFEPQVFEDDRGFFLESFRQSWFDDVAPGARFVQDNHSRSAQGTLRGLHYQSREPQGKLVRVISGAVFDVAVDIRRHSATCGQWVGRELSAANRHVMWVPEGFAHGFLVLTDTAEFVYKCTSYYDPGDQQGIAWNDPTLAIEWPEPGSEILLSDKDREGTPFSAAILHEAS